MKLHKCPTSVYHFSTSKILPGELIIRKLYKLITTIYFLLSQVLFIMRGLLLLSPFYRKKLFHSHFKFYWMFDHFKKYIHRKVVADRQISFLRHYLCFIQEYFLNFWWEDLVYFSLYVGCIFIPWLKSENVFLFTVRS